MASSVFEKFRERLEHHRAHPEHAMEIDLNLAIGFLLGAGFPSCAAAVATMMEEKFPEYTWDLMDSEER